MEKIGLDLGSSSVGWFLNAYNEYLKGVVTFSTGMVKGKSGGYTSPTSDRRESRSKRNLIRARKYRKWALLKILLGVYVPLDKEEFEKWSKYTKGSISEFPKNENFLKWLACDFTYQGGIKYKNPYELRVKALDEKLSNHELGRVLYHLVQRRGYKDIGEKDKETKKQIERRKSEGFDAAMKKNKTIAQSLKSEFLDKGKRARNQYPYREEYHQELELILKNQGFNVERDESVQKECNYIDSFVNSIYGAIIWQRPLKSQKGNIGRCTFEKNKQRCSLSHPVFEIFRTWQFINTIKYYDENEKLHFISSEERKKLFDYFLTKDSNFKFEDVKKQLDKYSIRKYNYPINPKTGLYDTTIAGMPMCKGLIDIFGEKVQEGLLDIEQYNEENAPKIVNGYSIYDLWHIVFDFEDDSFLEKFAIEKLDVSNEEKKVKDKKNVYSSLVELKNNITQGYSNLSLKAIRKILPFLKEGFLYNDAVVLAKMPELLGSQWEIRKEEILKAIDEAKEKYDTNQIIVRIANNLIDKHKGLVRAVIEGAEDQVSGYKDYTYKLQREDIEDVRKSCISFFGEESWKNVENKEDVIQLVGEIYQNYFYDEKRSYARLEAFTNIFKEYLKGFEIDTEKLYHHSDRENIYSSALEIDKTTREKKLPICKKTGLEILPVPLVNGIKNPMFNKSMSVLRKLINELIRKGKVNPDTEVVVELARELNDNNKRLAIEKYQKDRENTRNKIRQFLEEYSENKSKINNIEEKIPIFELWLEQNSEELKDKKKSSRKEELLSMEETERYELWLEQKGICMYTGKYISISELFSNAIDIEHTIPRSLLPDNTLANKTVAYKWYNKDVKMTKLPCFCDNYSKDTINGSAIEPRLEEWKKIRDKYKEKYKENVKPKYKEDINAKNKRVQDKHYYKLYYDYWKEKVARFEAEEIKDSWVQRQLVDTQMVSKYAREFLKLYFRKVSVQKGSVTAVFRKLYGFQEQEEIKNRAKHAHHAIDAAVLTLIPTNSSYRDSIVKEYYKAVEDNDKQALKRLRERIVPKEFNSQKLIEDIENTTLICNYEKDKILDQTKKRVRKRGKIQYLKDDKGKYIYDKQGRKIEKIAQGDTIRESLYQDTFLGKIRDVERNKDGLAIRENNDWKYKKDKNGNNEFIFVKRVPIADVVKDTSKIIDPIIRKLVEEQKNQEMIKDRQGNVIRHIRIKTKAGREVKNRIDYLSKYDYKNKYYAEAGSVPYGILCQKNAGSGVVRELILVASFEIAKEFNRSGKFNIESFIDSNEEYHKYRDWNKQLLKLGQKVFVLKNDKEFLEKETIDFQKRRLYTINQFSEGSIWLNYHLNALSKEDVKKNIAFIKDKIMSKYEVEHNLPEIVENIDIKDFKQRKDDYEKRKYRFDNFNDSFRLKRIVEEVGLETAKLIKNELDKYKAIPSMIEVENETLLLKMSKENWNYLLEGVDFEMSLDGEIRWLI